MLLDSNIIVYAAQPEQVALRQFIELHVPAVRDGRPGAEFHGLITINDHIAPVTIELWTRRANTELPLWHRANPTGRPAVVAESPRRPAGRSV